MSHRRTRSLPLVAALCCLLVLAACSSTPPRPPQPGPIGTYKLGNPYQIDGRWYYPSFDPAYDEIGIASWYGDQFHGLPTANGEVFDKNELTAAHPTMPLPSLVRVTNLANNRTLYLRVNDRGPFVGDRLIDLSQAAARELDFELEGTTPVRVQFLQLADASGRPPQPSAAPAAPAPMPEVQLARTLPAAQCAAGGSFIQVGAFAEPARAQRVVHQLEAALALPVLTEPPREDHLVRVRLGPLAAPQQTIAALRQLKQIGYAGAFLVQGSNDQIMSC
jgi:rare lipoprotein A